MSEPDFLIGSCGSLLTILIGGWLGGLSPPLKRLEIELWAVSFGSIAAASFAVSGWFFLG
jgi:hypothetical protein